MTSESPTFEPSGMVTGPFARSAAFMFSNFWRALPANAHFATPALSQRLSIASSEISKPWARWRSYSGPLVRRSCGSTLPSITIARDFCGKMFAYVEPISVPYEKPTKFSCLSPTDSRMMSRSRTTASVDMWLSSGPALILQ